MIFENRLKRCVTRIRGEEAGTGKSRLSAPGVGTYVRAPEDWSQASVAGVWRTREGSGGSRQGWRGGGRVT